MKNSHCKKMQQNGYYSYNKCKPAKGYFEFAENTGLMQVYEENHLMVNIIIKIIQLGREIRMDGDRC